MPYNFKDVIFYYILFSPFMVNLLYGHHLLEPLWSIGVEELFYIIWAPLFKWFKNHILFISVFVIIVRFILLISIIIFPLPHHLDQLIRLLQFEAMAIGALTAYMIFNSEKKIETYMIFSNPVQSCLILYLVISLFGREYLSNNFLFFNYLYTTEIVSTTVMNCVFAWLIVNVSLNGRSIIKLDNRILNFLGDISYGIYMYHMLIIFGIVLIFKNTLASMTNLLGTIVFYLIVMAGTLLVSSFSKMMFENYFLKFKTRFRTSL
jgi:peptidoglycan/LPS O-acetylase OafA/YrhL